MEETLRKKSERTLFEMGLNGWTRQLRESSFGKGPWDRNPNAVCFKWGWTAELDKLNNPPVVWNLRKESERTLLQMAWNGWTRQVIQSACEKETWKNNQNSLCSKLGLTAELDKLNNLPVEGILRKNSERTLFQIGLHCWTRPWVKQSSCGRDPEKRIRTHFATNWVERLN